MTTILFALGALVLLTLISGGYVFLIGCVRRKDLPWLVEEELKKTSYGKYYDYIAAANQWLIEHNAQDVYIKSYDGLRLHGLWVPAKNARGTILHAHGYRSSMLMDFGAALDFYHDQGMNMLIPDQRSHGKSQGRFITFGVKESRDMLCWLDFHNRKYGEFPLILNGISMGASTMMYLADRSLPENVKGIIADCGFTSPKEILSSVYKSVIRLPAAPTIWATELFARLFSGFSLWERDTRKTLVKNRLPILMIHGTEDGFVPCDMTRQAYAVCAGPKQLLLIEGADHGMSFPAAYERYSAAVAQFLDKNISTL